MTDTPGRTWRLFEDGACSAAWNMAVDEAILDAVAANISPPTLRLYRWAEGSVSLGRFQNATGALIADPCNMPDIPIVRRITGGRAILHGDDLTVSAVCSVEDLGFDGDAGVIALYERIAAGILQAFALLGIPAVLGACQTERRRVQPADCFAVISRADVIHRVTGRKLMGAALHRRDRWILQQMSIPLGTPEHVTDQDALRRAVFSAVEANRFAEPPPTLPARALQQAIIAGMRECQGGVWLPSGLCDWENVHAQDLVTRYRTLT